MTYQPTHRGNRTDVQLTVARLREVLATLPDDAKVWIDQCDEEGDAQAVEVRLTFKGNGEPIVLIA